MRVNENNKAASTVTPSGAGGARIKGTGDGQGKIVPVLVDPVANDVLNEHDTAW